MKEKLLQQLQKFIDHPVLAALIVCDAAILVFMLDMPFLMASVFVIGLVALAMMLGQNIDCSI